MKIKICGLKNIGDCIVSCEAGADMLGFNFYSKSARYISILDSQILIKNIKEMFPKVVCVGVFVNHSQDQIKAILNNTGLDLAQLSGDEPATLLDYFGDKAFKAIRPKNQLDAESQIKTLPSRNTSPAFLVDAYKKGSYGGTGETSDWNISQELAKHNNILLAGGLNPDNVAHAIREVKPWGVDVASGVESKKGKKDARLIRKFITNARIAHTNISAI